MISYARHPQTRGDACCRVVSATGTLAGGWIHVNRKTEVTVPGEMFCINGVPTCAGLTWQGRRIEGLLMNSRMVQGILDDLNTHPILQPPRVHELIERAKGRSRGGRRPPVSTSYGGGSTPRENVVRSADFLLLHGNGVSDPARIGEMVRQTRAVAGYRPVPILFNEDDHFDFEKPMNNMVAAIGEYCSWGYFDPGRNDYRDGYQSPPVNWGGQYGQEAGVLRDTARDHGGLVTFSN
jgi:hypothetical protein